MTHRGIVGALVVMAALFASAPALAADQDADAAAARMFTDEGDDAFRHGHYAAALDLYTRAAALSADPSLEEKITWCRSLLEPRAEPAPVIALPPARVANTTKVVAREPAPSDPLRTLAWTGLGLGVAGLGVAAVTGLASMNKVDDVKEQCAGAVCPQAARGDVESASTLGTASTISFVAGAAALATGAILLYVTRPSARQSATVSPYVSLGGAGVTGAF